MIPTYHQPQGFSSTYYRHLYQTNQDFHASSPNPFGPAVMSQAATKAETSDSKDVKPPADGADEAAESAAKTGNWWSWIQRPFNRDAKSETDKSEPDEPEAEEDSAEQTAERPRRAAR